MLEGPGKRYVQQIHALSLLQGARVVLQVGRVGLEDTCRAQVCLLVFPSCVNVSREHRFIYS